MLGGWYASPRARGQSRDSRANNIGGRSRLKSTLIALRGNFGGNVSCPGAHVMLEAARLPKYGFIDIAIRRYGTTERESKY